MHAGQAEYQHDADRGDHCIHGWLTSLRQKKARTLKQWAADVKSAMLRRISQKAGFKLNV
ncbi:hypothetical protein PPUJ20005_19530 [Pseudomonas putida]|nr:hypothetical protein PPUJ20005_19530 [Pseudomonas putida]